MTNLVEVLAACRKVAPQFKVMPELLAAIGEQECEKLPSNPNIWLPDVARLEQGYYRRYTKKMALDSVSEATLSCSWGIFQMMGLSLYEVGYFEHDWEEQSERYQEYWGDKEKRDGNGKAIPYMSEVNIPKAINRMLMSVEEQAYWAAKWFQKKMNIAKGDVPKALLYWNGGGDPLYDDKVIARWKRIKARNIL